MEEAMPRLIVIVFLGLLAACQFPAWVRPAPPYGFEARFPRARAEICIRGFDQFRRLCIGPARRGAGLSILMTF
jgi:hypothetical protein